MSVFITAEDDRFIITESGAFLILQEGISPLDIGRNLAILPRVTEFILSPRLTELTILSRTVEFKLVRDHDMALKISPRDNLDDMIEGEDYAFSLNLTQELKSKTVASYTYKVYDSNGDEVTDSMGGGSTIDEEYVILFGVIARDAGEYKLQFIVTCDDLLPDDLTPHQFHIEITLTVV